MIPVSPSRDRKMRLKSERLGNRPDCRVAVWGRLLDHFVIALQDVGRHFFRASRIERRVRIIFNAELDEAGKILAAYPGGQGERASTDRYVLPQRMRFA